MTDFTRDPGPLILPGIRAQSLDVLREHLDRAGQQGTWVVADLSLGAWRGHQVALEFSSQLRVELPRVGFPASAENRSEHNIEISYADIIGEFIDAEARGDRATIDSLNCASRIRKKAQDREARIFLVFAPQFGISWEAENLTFIRLCAQALRGTRSVLVLVGANDIDPEMPLDWNVTWWGDTKAPVPVEREDIAGLIPGVIPPDLADTLRRADLFHDSNLIPLSNGHWLVPPEFRRRPNDVPRIEFDQLGTLCQAHGWLDAYAQFYGNNMYVEPWFLYAEARRRFAEGGTGITIKLMERAIPQIRMGLDWGIFQSFVQGLRLASNRFADAAGISDPSTTLPTETRSFLLQSKGWGLVMINDLQRAEGCFRQALELTDSSRRDGREFLYLLNITALCRLKSGELDSAFVMEKEVEERRTRLAKSDRCLQYVNSINIARLYRRREELQEAEFYYRDAFSTTLGVRSESDAIYGNVVLAKLYRDSGKDGEAFAYWMRAGLHWAASGAPEAIGARIVNFILGEKLKPASNAPEAVAASLFRSILSAAAASGIAEVTCKLRSVEVALAPVFAYSEKIRHVIPHAVIKRALLSSGFSVFETQDVVLPQIVGENTLRLRGLLFELLQKVAPPNFLAGTGTIVIDDSMGREIPSAPEELLSSCVRLGVQYVAMDGEKILLDANIRAGLERCSQVSIGSAVESLAFNNEHAFVSFKRYRPPIMLSLAESRLCTILTDRPTIGEMINYYEETDLSENVLALLRGLEQKRVVNLDVIEGVKICSLAA